MSINQTFQFDNEADFTRSDTVVASNVGKLDIIDNPGQEFSQDFSSSSGFTYDNTKAEFVGGSVRQKSQTVNATLINPTAVTVDGNKITRTSGGGGWTAGASSSQTIASGDGYIEFKPGVIATDLFGGLTTNSNPAGDFAVLNFGVFCGNAQTIVVYTSGSALATVGTWVVNDVIRIAIENGVVVVRQNGTLIYTYVASPSYPLYFGGCIFTANAVIDGITITSGSEFVGSAVVLPAFSYTGLGTIQEVEESDFDETGTPRYIIADKYWNGSAWVASNGSYSQANPSATVVANLTSLVVTGASTVVVKIIFTDSFTIQSAVDLISVTVTGQKYAPTGYLEPIQPIQVHMLLEYAQTASEPSNTNIKLIFKIDGELFWFNGSAWVVSDGTSSQANTVSQANAAFDDLDLGSNSSIFIRWVLSTSSNTATPTITDASIEYNYGAPEVNPATCSVFGYIRNISGEPVMNAKITFTLTQTPASYSEANQNVILGIPVVATTDDDGYFVQDLIRSSEFDISTVYQVTIIKNQNKATQSGGNPLTFQVPDSDTKDITDLLQAS